MYILDNMATNKVTIKRGEYVRVTTGNHTRWYYY